MNRRVVSWDLVGWSEIADALGISVRTAHRYAALAEDPLPVFRFNGRLRARSPELAAWTARRLDEPFPPPPASSPHLERETVIAEARQPRAKPRPRAEREPSTEQKPTKAPAREPAVFPRSVALEIPSDSDAIHRVAEKGI